MATSDFSTAVLIDITDTSVNVLAHSPNSYCEEEDIFFGPTKKPQVVSKESKVPGTSPTCGKLVDVDSFEICDAKKTFSAKNDSVTLDNSPGIKLLQTGNRGSGFDVTFSLKDTKPMRNVCKDGETCHDILINEKRVEALDSLNDMQMDEIFKEASALARRLMSLSDKSTDEKEKSLNQHDTSSNIEALHRDGTFCCISKETAPFTLTDDELCLEDACLQKSNTDLEHEDEAERRALNVTKDIVSVPLDCLENKCDKVKPTIQSDKENVPLSSEVKDTTGEQAKPLKRSGTFNMKKPSIKRQSHLKTTTVKSDQQKSVRSSNAKATTTMKKSMSNLKSKPSFLNPPAKTLNSINTFSKSSKLPLLSKTNKINSKGSSTNGGTRTFSATNRSKRPTDSNTLKPKSANTTITRSNNKIAPSFKPSVPCNGVTSSNKTKTQMKHPVKKRESSTTSNDPSSFSKKSHLNSLSSEGSIPSSSMNLLNKSFSLVKAHSLSSNSSDAFINKNTRDIPTRAATPPAETTKRESSTEKIVSPVIRKAVTRSQDGSVSTPGSSSFTIADPPLAVSTPCHNEHRTFNLEEKKNSSTLTIQLNRTRVKSCTESSNVTRPILQPPRISRLKRPALVKK